MKSKTIAVRITEEQEEKLKRILEELEQKAPGAEANLSTIARYSLNKYIEAHEKEIVTVEIPTKDLSVHELEILSQGLNHLYNQLFEQNPDNTAAILNKPTRQLMLARAEKMKEAKVRDE